MTLTVIRAHACFVGKEFTSTLCVPLGFGTFLSQEQDVKGCLNTDVKSQWAGKAIPLDYEQNPYSGLFMSVLIVIV